MKKLILLAITLAVSVPAFAQKYLQVDVNNEEMGNSIIRNPKAGYGYCQINQIILLDQLIKDSRTNVHSLAVEIDRGQRFQNRKLYDLLIHQVMLLKIKQQLKTQGLYNLIQNAEKTKSLSVLKLDSVKIDIEAELLGAFETSLDKAKWRDLSDRAIDNLKQQIFKEMLNSIIKGAYRVAVSAELKAQIGRFLAGQISKQVMNQALKSTLTSFGKNLLMDVGRGAILDILTLPLQSFIQPKEGQLADMWEEIPALMINPEWVNPVGSKVPAKYAWETHCLALLRKPKSAEYSFNKYRLAERRAFLDYLEMLPELR